MELSKKILVELQTRLKIGNRRGVHLNAVPANSRYKFDLQRLKHINQDMPNNFIKALLEEQPLKFKVSWKNNVEDLNTLFKEEQAQLVKIKRSFETLINQTEAIESEKGINTFGFGFPILVRRDQSDNKLTVAPILIWSLRINRTKEFNTWEINRNLDDPIYLNEILINHLQIDSETKIEQIPSEMLDDGLISKEGLIDICTNLIKSINTSVSSDIKDVFSKKLSDVVSISSKEYYEKMQINSTNAIIDFGGLFSIFEVQKQNIINDYNYLLENQKLGLDLKDFKNTGFQPISSIETDPSQQNILHSLEKTRNVLIQGPPGTGKSQTLLAVLINALENCKKTIVVCEKRTALEVLHNALVEKGLNNHCVLIRDIIKDRRTVVDSVRDRIDNSSFAHGSYSHSKENLDNLLKKAKKLIESINGRHKKLDQKLLGDKTWTTIVGELLSELSQNDKISEIELDMSEFDYTSKELYELTEMLENGQRLFLDYKPYSPLSFLKPNKLIGNNPYFTEQEINDCFDEYEKIVLRIQADEKAYRNEYLALRNSELAKQIEQGNRIQNKIDEIHNNHKQDPDFIDEKRTNSLAYKALAFFSKQKRKVIRDRKTIRDCFYELKDHYNKCIDLPNFQLSDSIKTIFEIISETNIIIKNVCSDFQTKALNEYESINIFNIPSPNYQTETTKRLKNMCIKLINKINTDDWTKYKIEPNNFTDTIKSINSIIQKKKLYFNAEVDIFTIEFKWFQFFNELPSTNRLLINLLKREKDWRKSFLVFYLNSLLIRYADLELPTSDNDHVELNNTLECLGNEQLKFICEYWYSKQILAKSNFEKRNINISVENLYNKRSSHRFKRLSLRRIVQSDPDLFTTFFPIIFTSPDVASNLFSRMNGYFDIVMFDEASQLKLEDNLPAILKGKQVIIAGDEHQMPPSNYFSKVFDGTIEDEDDIEEDDEMFINKDDIVLSCESLLDFGVELNFEKRHLDFHYRSKHPYLIDFSNYAFYNQRLKPLPNTFDYTPIKFIHVDGTFSDHINDAEAEMVLSIIENNIHRYPNGNYPSIGVATFNIAQRNYIKSKIIERQRLTKFEKFNSKIQELEENGMFIKNLENIQGDERDVVILSTTYGPGKDGRFAQRFGPINHSKGYKLLNVIITRAKYKVYVCSSVPENVFMNYKDYLFATGSNNKRAVFYSYLAYCKAVSDRNNDSRELVLTALRENSKISTPSNLDNFGELESPFEEEVYQRLINELDESKLIPQFKVSEFRIDLVYDPKIEGVPKIAIECDGAKFHSSKEAYVYDCHRQKVLERHGFVFHRIWSTNWWRNPQKETNRLVEFIKGIESQRDYKGIAHSKITHAFTDDLDQIENYVLQKSFFSSENESAIIETVNRDSSKKSEQLANQISIGNVVTVKYINDGDKVIVHIDETASNEKFSNGIQRINSLSPLAISILGHRVGDIVKIGKLDNFVEIMGIES